MNKEKMVRNIGLLSFIFPAFLIWLADDFTPLFFDLDNPILQTPNNLFLLLLTTTIIICLLILRYFWKNQYFDCQNSFFPPMIIEYLPPLLLTFLIYSISIFLILSMVFVYLNGKFDNSQPYTITTTVVDKKVTQSKTFHYKLTVKQHNQTYFYLDVSQVVFYKVELNDKIIIKAKHGYFNVPWRQSFYIEKQKSFL